MEIKAKYKKYIYEIHLKIVIKKIVEDLFAIDKINYNNFHSSLHFQIVFLIFN